ncbi:fatty acid synthase [Trichonephila clavipes]|nr:fatty acid synthase [Trichonephila clavipes]
MFIAGTSWSEIQKCCPNNIFLSRHLADESVTVSGPKNSIKTLVDKMQVENGLTQEVESYGYALHCHLVHAATQKLQNTLEKPPRDNDRFGLVTKSLVFGTEGIQIEFSFICDPDHAKRTPEVVKPSFHRKCNQAVRHMTQLSRHTQRRQPSHCRNDATHKVVTHDEVTYKAVTHE